MIHKDNIEELNRRFEKASPERVLQYFIRELSGRVALATSLGSEDQVLTDMICRVDKTARVFTLDTGRLFPETYSLIERTETRYGIRMELFFPDYRDVEKMLAGSGVNLFRESVEKRKECCAARKTEPLQRAFSTLDAWICGLRREQSVTRRNARLIEWDEGNGLVKINPLIDWSEARVWDYIRQNSVPYNELHDAGFPSIGCQPCTRAVREGEDVRSGRWWWESPEHKECGLHER